MSELSQELQSFIQSSNKIFSEGLKLAGSVPPNMAQVWPGGALFNTIQDAINSIANASAQLQYQVAVGSGTFNENVAMKDYVYIIGAGQGKTIITAPAQMNFEAGVVNSASGCGISEVTINAPGGGWGACPTGIKINGSGKFHISGVTINSGGSSDVGNNTRGITNNTGAYSGNIILGSSIIILQGGENTTAVGVDCLAMGNNPPVMLIDVSSIHVTTGGEAFGVTTSGGSTVTIDQSKVVAALWSLYDSDNRSLITANQCTLDGPVSQGVVVNN